MLVVIVILLMGLVLFYLVNERSHAIYKDHRFWLVVIGTVVLLAGVTARYYGLG